MAKYLTKDFNTILWNLIQVLSIRNKKEAIKHGIGKEKCLLGHKKLWEFEGVELSERVEENFDCKNNWSEVHQFEKRELMLGIALHRVDQLKIQYTAMYSKHSALKQNLFCL